MKIHRISLSAEGYARLSYIAALEQISPKDWMEQRINEAWSLREGSAREPDKPIIQLDDKPALDKMECKKEGEAIICTAKSELTTEARTALAYILAELEAGREPTSREAADKVGLTPTGLGMQLSKHGLKAQNTHRGKKSVKIYTKPMKARIKEILARE